MSSSPRDLDRFYSEIKARSNPEVVQLRNASNGELFEGMKIAGDFGRNDLGIEDEDIPADHAPIMVAWSTISVCAGWCVGDTLGIKGTNLVRSREPGDVSGQAWLIRMPVGHNDPAAAYYIDTSFRPESHIAETSFREQARAYAAHGFGAVALSSTPEEDIYALPGHNVLADITSESESVMTQVETDAGSYPAVSVSGEVAIDRRSLNGFIAVTDDSIRKGTMFSWWSPFTLSKPVILQVDPDLQLYTDTMGSVLLTSDGKEKPLQVPLDLTQVLKSLVDGKMLDWRDASGEMLHDKALLGRLARGELRIPYDAAYYEQVFAQAKQGVIDKIPKVLAGQPTIEGTIEVAEAVRQRGPRNHKPLSEILFRHAFKKDPEA